MAFDLAMAFDCGFHYGFEPLALYATTFIVFGFGFLVLDCVVYINSVLDSVQLCSL